MEIMNSAKLEEGEDNEKKIFGKVVLGTWTNTSKTRCLGNEIRCN
tara:strand:- start:1309 stop:1443 length:135 start_codon:yes stop_codon:yes gene_type:complete